MVLLKEIESKKMGLVGITDDGQSIVLETPIPCLFVTEEKKLEENTDKLIKRLKESPSYIRFEFQYQTLIGKGTTADFIAIPYVSYGGRKI